MADPTEDQLAELLCRLMPEDGEGKGAHWVVANKLAASDIVKIMPTLKEKAASTTTSRWGATERFALLAAIEGVRIRNEYLAKAG